MKKKEVIVFVGVIGVAITPWWLLNHRRCVEKVTDEASHSNDISVTDPSQHSLQNSLPESTTPVPSEFELRQKQREREQAIEDSKAEWRTPIEFYRKVVDQNDSPIPEARVDFSCNDLSSTGTSDYRALSDTNGLFSLNTKGNILIIRVAKEGSGSEHTCPSRPFSSASH